MPSVERRRLTHATQSLDTVSKFTQSSQVYMFKKSKFGVGKDWPYCRAKMENENAVHY